MSHNRRMVFKFEKEVQTTEAPKHSNRKAKMGAVPLDCIFRSAWTFTLTGTIEPLLPRIHSGTFLQKLSRQTRHTKDSPSRTSVALVSLVSQFSPASLLFLKCCRDYSWTSGGGRGCFSVWDPRLKRLKESFNESKNILYHLVLKEKVLIQ